MRALVSTVQLPTHHLSNEISSYGSEAKIFALGDLLRCIASHNHRFALRWCVQKLKLACVSVVAVVAASPSSFPSCLVVRSPLLSAFCADRNVSVE